ncbi:ubiquinone biosynthesis O-methyltransferase, mitochondrial-like [Anopheles nili]|uniref:ubiquinone biosynthesis O-methyltransferase, mitochondrial-like n=1 Tax=Anopheles nili TaxID=185578 RepID=UPI00237B549C|nr:ubiquinone biosynthesis O-methyltransferase, mitochondrial-like [Anopheles nili]
MLIYKLFVPQRLYLTIRTYRDFSSAAKFKQASFSNVDEKEMEQFTRHSAEWWHPHGPARGLLAMNAIRVPLIRDGLIAAGAVEKRRIFRPNVLEKVNILEVGCGGGFLTEALARLRANVVGIDPCEELIKVAIEHAKKSTTMEQNHIQYKVETIEQHASKHGERYDAVIASEVLDHINDKELFIKQCLDALKPGGSIFISTISRTVPAWVGIIFAGEQILKLIPEGSHEWHKFITPQEVERILCRYNCNTVLVRGMFYQFWSNQWSWTENTDMHYALHALKNYSYSTA